VPSLQPDLQPYQHLLSPAAFAQLFQAVERPLVPSIRLNTLKTTVERAESAWPTWYNWEIEPVPFCSAGWRITAGGEGLARTAEFKLGYYYIQEAASMLPAELFHLEELPEFTPGGKSHHGNTDPGTDRHTCPGGQCQGDMWSTERKKKELLVLDLAAAPGGKTTHLVSRLNDRGLVVANDSSSGRIAPLRANIQDWGATNTVITNYLGELWGGWFPETFDRVLLDAPCSGQSLRTAERRKSRPVSDKERKALQAQQIRLLVSGFQALRPGGELVYATCTLHPAEDEAVLDALLARYPAAADIVSIEHIQAPALLSDGERQYHPAVGNALRLWPHLYDTAGFFAALIQKRESVTVHRQGRPARQLRERGFAPLKTIEHAELMDGLLQRYGFDLAAVLEALHLSLWKRKQRIYALPELYLAHVGDLPAVAAGMLVAERKGGNLVPSHELVSRFGREFTSGRLTISLEEGERWLKGHELRGVSVPEFGRGAVVLVQDEWGRMLGRGKVLGQRVRNLLPRRLLY